MATKLPTRPPRTPTPEEREHIQGMAQLVAEGRAERARKAREHAIQREQDAAKRARSEEWAEEWRRQMDRVEWEAERAARARLAPLVDGVA